MCIVRIMDKLPERVVIGTMKSIANDQPRLMHRQKLLATKTIRKILKMQESLFKYDNFIPRNDREADASPESIRWK